MNTKMIKDLVGFIARSNVSEVIIKTDDFELSVKKEQSSGVVSSSTLAVEETQAVEETPIVNQAASPPPVAKDTPSKTINAPMIGTFYTSKNPDSPPFIKVGDMIKKGDIIGIIEAMKLFNEIEAEESGKVVELLVDNASPVEFDQPLVRIEEI